MDCALSKLLAWWEEELPCLWGGICARPVLYHGSTEGWMTHCARKGWDLTPALRSLQSDFTQQTYITCVCTWWHTECRLSQSEPLASVPPRPLTSTNIIPGFCRSRSFVWIQQDQGLRQKRKCQRAEEGEERPIPCFFFLLFSRHVRFIPTQGPLHPLCSLPFQSHLQHLSSGGAFYYAAHTASPIRPIRPASLCSFMLLSFLLQHFSFLPEILLFVVTTCFQNYLYETPPKESISSVRADIALSGDKARVAQWEVARHKRVKGSTGS